MFQLDNTIASAIQTKLNTIAEALHTSEDITNKIIFKVTANYDDYYKITEMEYKMTDSIRYTPVLLQKTQSSMVDDFLSGFYTESYSLIVYGFQKDKNDLEKILDNYVYNESSVDKEVMTDYVVKKNTSRPQFQGLFADGSGRDEKRATYIINFTWDYVLGGIISDDVTITIDSVAVTHVQLGLTSEKISIGNVAYGNNTKPVGASGVILSLTLPLQIGNTKHTALLTDLLNKSYNKSYAISVAFSTIYTMAYTMTLKRGSINYVRDQIISFTCEFEEALPRTTVTIDSVAVPVLRFAMTNDITKGDGLVAPNTKVLKYEAESLARTWRIRFGYDSTQSKNVDLLKAILDSDFFDTSYTLGITVAGITAKTYTVMLASGTYDFEQTGELSYECVFVEKAGIV